MLWLVIRPVYWCTASDLRDNASDCEHDPHHTTVSERFATIDPPCRDDQAGLRMPDDGTCDRTRAVDDVEL